MSFEEDQDGSFTTYLAEGDKVRDSVRIDLPRTVGQNPRTAADFFGENDRLLF